MRIVGFIRFHRVVVLIDSGSTHNFVDSKLAASLGIHPQPHDGIKVQIANGQEVASPGRSREVEVKLSGIVFRTDLFILPLAGCDAVLGIQWLRTLGPIRWHFSALTMKFTWAGSPCVLQGLKQGPGVVLEGEESFKLPKHEKKGLLLQLMSHSLSEAQLGTSIQARPPSPIAEILKEFEDVFREPKGLPPPRAHDHAILLQAGAQLVSVRPYRYSYF
jgi:hypothetical protein